MDWVHITPHPGDATPGPYDNYYYSLHACTCRHLASWSIYRTQLFLFHIQKLKHFSPPSTTRLLVRPLPYTPKHWFISPLSSFPCACTHAGFISGGGDGAGSPHEIDSFIGMNWLYTVHDTCLKVCMHYALKLYWTTCKALPYFHSRII